MIAGVVCVGLVCVPPAAGRAEDVVLSALRPYVKVLNRSIDTYHCVPLVRIGPAATGLLDGSTLLSYLEDRRTRFWDTRLPVRRYATASGLYAGVDPVTCRHFGGVGDGWALIRIRLPHGLTFLDLRREQMALEDRPHVSPAVPEGLRAAGCDVHAPATLVMGRESGACRDIALATVRRLGVNAILADLPALKLESCDRSGNGVFILLEGVEAPLAAAALFTKDMPVDDPLDSERLMIREIYTRARRAGSARTPPWLDVPGAVVDQEMKAWMEDHLWSCGALPEATLP